MKRVKFLLDTSLASHGSVKAGTVLDLENDQAKELIKLDAVEVSSDPTAQEAAVAKHAAANASS